jgi:hypothetical protein
MWNLKNTNVIKIESRIVVTRGWWCRKEWRDGDRLVDQPTGIIDNTKVLCIFKMLEERTLNVF